MQHSRLLLFVFGLIISLAIQGVAATSSYAETIKVSEGDAMPARLYKLFPIWDVEVAVSPPPTESPQAVAAKVIAAQAGATE